MAKKGFNKKLLFIPLAVLLVGGFFFFNDNIKFGSPFNNICQEAYGKDYNHGNYLVVGSFSESDEDISDNGIIIECRTSIFSDDKKLITALDLRKGNHQDEIPN